MSYQLLLKGLYYPAQAYALKPVAGQPQLLAAQFANVIRTSMREQLLPYESHMAGIAKVGDYPVVVQHTQWDQDHFGKGFYNLHFAPGWTVASIWELLTNNRAKEYLARKK